MVQGNTESQTPSEAARAVLEDLGLREAESPRLRPVSGHNSSILVPCDGADGRGFLLKFFVPPAEGRFYPAGVRLDDYPRREAAFYRYLDSVDPGRRQLPAPKTILIDSQDPPRWMLLERIPAAVGPKEEVLGLDHVFELLVTLQSIGIENLMGRRHFPLNQWDGVSYRDRVRLMYDPVLYVIGEKRWQRCQEFFEDALRWLETRQSVLVHGDFTEQNIVVDEDGHPFLIDFERVGIGNPDHDFAWFWIHAHRSEEWRRRLLARHFRGKHGSERIRTEWGVRAALVYLALRRLRFGYLMFGTEDRHAEQNVALLDAALLGGEELFPRELIEL